MSTSLLVLVMDDLDKVHDVLEAWESVGMPGVTMFDSIGSKRLAGMGRDDLPLLVSLRAMLEGEEMPNRVIFSVVDDEIILEKAIMEAERIVGDFRNKHTGIMFVLPVARAWGILKAHPHHR